MRFDSALMSLVSTPSFARALSIAACLSLMFAWIACSDAERDASGAAPPAQGRPAAVQQRRWLPAVACEGRLFERGPCAGADEFGSTMSLSNAYGVSCRARAGRAGATPRRGSRRLAPRTPHGAHCWLLVPPLRPAWPSWPPRGELSGSRRSYLPELICLQKRGNLSSKTWAGAFSCPRVHRCTSDCAPRPTLPRVDLGLAGRACVVTGASRGIGLATARALCAEDARVLLVARTRGDPRGGARDLPRRRREGRGARRAT